MCPAKIADETTAAPISQTHAPHGFSALIVKFLRRPAHERFPLFLKLARGFLAARSLDESSWPLFERGACVYKRNGRISVSRFVTFCGNCQIAVAGRTERPARLSIGEFTSIGPSTVINVAESLTIGRRCLISWNCDIMDTDFHTIVLAEGEPSRSVSAPVNIGDDVWIGARCIILKGTTIGDNCVIGAGSVVSGNIPPNSLAVGNPAHVVRTIAGWKR